MKGNFKGWLFIFSSIAVTEGKRPRNGSLHPEPARQQDMVAKGPSPESEEALAATRERLFGYFSSHTREAMRPVCPSRR